MDLTEQLAKFLEENGINMFSSLISDAIDEAKGDDSPYYHKQIAKELLDIATLY